MDSSIEKPLDELIQYNDEAIITAEGNPGLYVQWALIFSKGHPILKKTIDLVVTNIKNNNHPNDIHKMTGPSVYTKAINEVHMDFFNNKINHVNKIYIKYLSDIECLNDSITFKDIFKFDLIMDNNDDIYLWENCEKYEKEQKEKFEYVLNIIYSLRNNGLIDKLFKNICQMHWSDVEGYKENNKDCIFDLIKLIYSNYKISDDILNEIFIESCNLPYYAYWRDSGSDYNDLYYCWGHLDLIKFLYSTEKIKNESLIDGFKNCCESGSLDIAKYIFIR
jgi:hypothetical protein